jgi:hypothetical protein
MKMPSKPVTLLIAVLIFGLGFVSGMEYKAFQIRSAISKAFSGVTSASPSPTPVSVVEEAKKEMVVIDKKVGDEIVLATATLKVNQTEEVKTLSAKYSAPKVAKEGTKFVTVNLDITNTTKSEYSFAPDDVFLLVDNQKREYTTYSDSIGAIDNYLNYKSLSPSIKQTGFLVYEIPDDDTSYSLVTSKAGSKELYIIKLK